MLQDQDQDQDRGISVSSGREYYKTVLFIKHVTYLYMHLCFSGSIFMRQISCSRISSVEF